MTLFWMIRAGIFCHMPHCNLDSILDGSPSVIVYVAGMTDSGACEKNEALAIQTNTPTALINEAARRNILFIFISTDLGMFNVMSTFTAVFDGLDAPYKEDAKTHPLSAYSRSKLSGETAVKAANGRYVIVRCALMLGPPPVIPGTNSCRIGFITNGVKNPPLKLFTDEYRTPVHVKDIANLISVITAQRDHIGNQIIHMGGPESVSKYTMGCMMVDAMNLDPSRTVVPSKMSDVNVGFPRPPNVTLDSSVAHGMIKPTPLIDAIRDSVKHLAK